MNFVSRKGRTLENGQLVGVHFNSHRKTFSIVLMSSRKTVKHVLGYSDQITLVDCTTKIDKSKQQSVRKTGVKDRHAYIVGYIENLKAEQLGYNVYYDPNLVDDFVDKNSMQPLKRVSKVNLITRNNKPIVTYTK